MEKAMGRCRQSGCEKDICCIECEERCQLPCQEMDRFEYSAECKEYVVESKGVLNEILQEIEERIKFLGIMLTSEEEGVEEPDGKQCFEDGRIQGRYEELTNCRDLIKNYIKRSA